MRAIPEAAPARAPARSSARRPASSDWAGGLLLALPLLAAGPLGFAGGCDRGAAAARPSLADVGAAPPAPRRISALGRLEPEDGLIRIAGPSGGDAVIAELRVDDGDLVEKGQVIALLDTLPMLEARRERLEAELANARSELLRHATLNTSHVVSDSQREDRETRVRVAEAELHYARAELARARVRSPIAGRVIQVHTREGERVGAQGIMELGRTDHMFAIAEIYEDDVSRVRVGQLAHVSSPALERPLSGRVEWVQLKVAKQDTFGTDPAARKDARVVEVEIRLDESEPAAGLTNLQVEIEIEP